jgi:hypothetical protein
MAKQLEEIILTEDQKDQLDELSAEYDEISIQLKSLEAKQKALNSVIKSTMTDFGVTKYVSKNNVSLSISSRPNVSFDEDKLLALCKNINCDGLVKTKEYVDMNVLESCCYNDKKLVEDLKTCQIVKPDIITLKCTQKKLLKEG